VAGLDSETDRAIVEAVIALAHGLHISVVAEGIETEAQFELLRALGCDVGQGYLFARPLPAAEAGQLLSPRRAGSATRAEGGLRGQLGGAGRGIARTAKVVASRAGDPGRPARSRVSPKAVA
jgi:predicted signal transduction protein with EAL and GGDEF domain